METHTDIPLRTKLLFIIIFILFLVGIPLFVIVLKQKTKTPNKNMSTIPFVTIPPLSLLPTPAIVSSSSNQDAAIPVTLSLNSPLSLPREIKVFRIRRRIEDEFVNKITMRLSFPKTPTQTTPESKIWEDPNGISSLLIQQGPGYLQYQNKDSLAKSDIGAPPVKTYLKDEEVIDIAHNFLQNNGLYPQNTPLITIQKYSQTTTGELGTEGVVPTPTLRVVSLALTANSLPINVQFSQPERIQVWVDIYGIVKKITYYNLQLENSITLSTPSFEDIQKKIRDNNAILVSYADKPIDKTTPPKISSATITDISLIYLDDKQSNYLQPVLLLRGVGGGKTGPTQVEFYLPLN